MTRTIRTWILLAALLAAAMVSSACYELSLGSARDTVQKTFRVEPGGKLFLQSDTGSVEVNSAGSDEVRIDVEREVRGASDAEAQQDLAQLRLDFRQEGRDVYIEAKRDHSFGFNWGNRLRLRFAITVPAKYSLDVKTGGGSITVRDLEGDVQARTSGGSLHFGQIRGSVSGHTSGGSITVEGGSGPMQVNTSGGSIRVGKVNGPVKAHTSGGSISVDEVQGDIQASTSGGSVNATITKQPQGDCELRTSGGSVHARLARNLNLDLSARTSGGSVRTDVPITVQGEVNRSRVEGKMNQGGPRLLLHTSGGGISIDAIN
jgi:DUF4097 and DUF4098 domain-containing protein YvlB